MYASTPGFSGGHTQSGGVEESTPLLHLPSPLWLEFCQCQLCTSRACGRSQAREKAPEHSGLLNTTGNEGVAKEERAEAIVKPRMLLHLKEISKELENQQMHTGIPPFPADSVVAMVTRQQVRTACNFSMGSLNRFDAGREEAFSQESPIYLLFV